MSIFISPFDLLCIIIGVHAYIVDVFFNINNFIKFSQLQIILVLSEISLVSKSRKRYFNCYEIFVMHIKSKEHCRSIMAVSLKTDLKISA